MIPRRLACAGLAVLLLASCSSTSSGAPRTSHRHKHHDDSSVGDSSAPAAPAAAAPSGPASWPQTACPATTVAVHDAPGLSAALAAAKPGTVIRMAAGSYDGRFIGTAVGTAAKPIFVCAAYGAIIMGGGITGGYGFHLDHAAYWRLVNFAVQNAQKGVVLDATTHTVLDSLTVTHIGDEGIHLRAASTDDVVVRSTIADTGKRRDKFGEGVYVGTAKSNWCTYSDCKPDPSNRNLIIGNRIGATTAESIDIKEGTSLGVIAGNTFDGSKLSGADSWVDLKGNSWLITGNTGNHSSQDGFQTHQIVDGDGVGNIFTRNVANVDGPGYGFHLTPIESNVVRCDNTQSGAKQGLTNATCAH